MFTANPLRALWPGAGVLVVRVGGEGRAGRRGRDDGWSLVKLLPGGREEYQGTGQAR